MLTNCDQCGEFTGEHRHMTEAFEVFGAVYCEACALEALTENFSDVGAHHAPNKPQVIA